ncbi:MAG TPA: Holliday junction resolvase RuvX [Polyangiaceae bacterium]|nr:Holliday junction resolvase RuvX [Polyangiaceae bacterium]
MDVGTVRIGVAVADELGLLAHPRPPVAASPRARALASLAELARDEGLERFVVGLPLRSSGVEGRAAEFVREFAARLVEATGLEVELWDERFSTVEASRQLRASGVSAKKGRAFLDSAAACVILQSWLDARRPGGAP